MCGIVGLHLKTLALRDRLGALLTLMLEAMTSRGPDSAGVAIYDDDLADGLVRYSLRGGGNTNWSGLAERIDAEVHRRGEGIVLVAAGDILDRLRTIAPEVRVVGH